MKKTVLKYCAAGIVVAVCFLLGYAVWHRPSEGEHSASPDAFPVVVEDTNSSVSEDEAIEENKETADENITNSAGFPRAIAMVSAITQKSIENIMPNGNETLNNDTGNGEMLEGIVLQVDAVPTQADKTNTNTNTNTDQKTVIAENDTTNHKQSENEKAQVVVNTNPLQGVSNSSDRENDITGVPAEETKKDVPSDTAQDTSSGQAQHRHQFEKVYWYGSPSCKTENNYYNLICGSCGENGGDGTDIIPHAFNSTETVGREGCVVYRILTSQCSVCGMEQNSERIPTGEEHEWITGEADSYWDELLQDFVTPTVVYCSRCYKPQ